MSEVVSKYTPGPWSVDNFALQTGIAEAEAAIAKATQDQTS